MKKRLLLNISVWLGAIIFHLLFWGEQMGLNTLLFTLLILAALGFLYPETKSSRSVLLLAGGLLLSSVFVAINSSILSKIIYWITFIFLVGKTQEKELRFLFFSFFIAFINFFRAPINFVKNLREKNLTSVRWENTKRYFKLAIIPIIVVFVFFQIYSMANVRFAEIGRQVTSYISESLSFEFSFSRLSHILLGFFTLGMLLYKSKFSIVEKIENHLPIALQRHRKPYYSSIFTTKKLILGLKQEYQTGVILLILLNVLLFLVNLTDIRYVWFDSAISSPRELSNFVHEGTYFLILSIFIAAAVLIWFFRGNLNFYKENGLLKKLAFLWIAQNGILALSLARRNWKYVVEYGLAHKRLGVFIFLLMVLIGLVFLYLKVEKKTSFYHLLSQNSWSIWLVLLLASGVNWDVAITRYNLSGQVKSEKIDSQYLTYGMSDKNLFLLKENEALLIFNGEQNKLLDVGSWIANKELRFERRMEKLSWLSWNYSDWRNGRYLEGE